MKIKKIIISEKKLVELIDKCDVPNVSHDYWWGDNRMLNVWDDDYKVYFEFTPPSNEKTKLGFYTDYKPLAMRLTWVRKNINKARRRPVRVTVDWMDGYGPDFSRVQESLVEYFGKRFH